MWVGATSAAYPFLLKGTLSLLKDALFSLLLSCRTTKPCASTMGFSSGLLTIEIMKRVPS